MKLRIDSDGTFRGTKVYNEMNEEVEGITSIVFKLGPHPSRDEAEVTLTINRVAVHSKAQLVGLKVDD